MRKNSGFIRRRERAGESLPLARIDKEREANDSEQEQESDSFECQE